MTPFEKSWEGSDWLDLDPMLTHGPINFRQAWGGLPWLTACSRSTCWSWRRGIPQKKGGCFFQNMEKCQEAKQQMSTTHIYLLGLFVRTRNNICKALVVLMMGKSSIFLSLDTQALLMVPKYLIDRSTLISLLFSWPWDNHHNRLLWSPLVTVEENKT